MDIKKEKYDYYYSYSDFPKTVLLREKVITICYILTESGVVGRGISVCSKQDTYNEDIGKQLAKGHALRAIKGRHLDNFKRREVVSRLIQCKCPFTKKSERNPDLSWWERKFLFGAKNVYKHTTKSGFPQIEFKLNIGMPAMAMADAMQRFRQLPCNRSIVRKGF